MNSGKHKKLRCHDCGRIMGILKKDMLELKCPKCGAVHAWNPKTKTLSRVRKRGEDK